MKYKVQNRSKIFSKLKAKFLLSIHKMSHNSFYVFYQMILFIPKLVQNGYIQIHNY